MILITVIFFSDDTIILRHRRWECIFIITQLKVVNLPHNATNLKRLTTLSKLQDERRNKPADTAEKYDTDIE